MIPAYKQSIFSAAVVSLTIFCCGCLTTADYKTYRVVADFVMEMEELTWLCHEAEVIAREVHEFFEIDPIDESFVLFNEISTKARTCAAQALSKSQALYMRADQRLQEQPEAQAKLKRVFSVWESTMNLIPRFTLSQSLVPRIFGSSARRRSK
jgi:hypothetical protein